MEMSDRSGFMGTGKLDSRLGLVALLLLVGSCLSLPYAVAFEDDYGPKLMAYQGCSISSPSFHVGRALLEAHTGKHVMRFRMEQLRCVFPGGV